MTKEKFEKGLYAISASGVEKSRVVITNESELEFYLSHKYEVKKVDETEEVNVVINKPLKTTKYKISDKNGREIIVEISDENELEVYKKNGVTISKVDKKAEEKVEEKTTDKTDKKVEEKKVD